MRSTELAAAVMQRLITSKTLRADQPQDGQRRRPRAAVNPGVQPPDDLAQSDCSFFPLTAGLPVSVTGTGFPLWLGFINGGSPSMR
jgi:hypothetical protein